MTSDNLFKTLQVAPSSASLLTAPPPILGLVFLIYQVVPCRGHALTDSYGMCERAATSVPATLCKRCCVLRHTSDQDSHIGLSAATARPRGVLSVYLREFPGDWHPF